MTTVAVVYHSATGHTRLLAEAVRDGAASVAGTRVHLVAIEGGDIVEGRYRNEAVLADLDAADAILFGCPTHMGSVSAEMKAFLDATVSRWATRAWVDKAAAGFTVSGTPSGDKLQALQAILVCAMQLGMIWVGQSLTSRNPDQLNRLGIYLGAGAQADRSRGATAVFEPDLRTGTLLGERVARVARALRGGAG